MGATLSHLCYASRQQSYPYPNKHGSRQLQQGCGPTLALGNEDAASPSITNLCTRLGALEKDLQNSRAENTNKETVIRYLLQSSVSSAHVKESTVQVKEQLLILKTNIEQANKGIEEIKDKLRKAEDTVTALSMPSVSSSRLQSTSTSFSSRSYLPPKSDIVTEDLIDLLGCNQKPDSANLVEEGTTLLDELDEDDSDIEGIFKNTTPDQTRHQSSDSDFEESPYIVHFTNSDEDAKPQDTVKVSTKKVRVPRDSSDFVRPLGLQSSIHILSEKFVESSPENASSPSSPNSTPTSCNSSSSEIPPLNDSHAKLFNEAFSQLKTLDLEGGHLEKSMGIVSTLAGKVSSFGVRNQAEPSRLTVQAPTEGQDLHASVGNNTIEPRWSPETIFDSTQDRETAVLINKRSAQAGARDVPFPDFFKHGIRYVPRLYEQDVYRTVAIAGLPLSITMKALLEKVRGGMLVDAKLLDTAKITGSNTALVTFLHERSAMAFEDHAKRHPITVSKIVTRVAVVPTPTWPIPINLRTGIEEYGRTRCFEVHNIPRNISLPTLRQELTASPVMKSDSLECMRLGADRVLGLRFSSIRAAGQSSVMFSKTLRYRGCTVQCIPDPCAQPLETLLGQRTDISEVVEEDTPEPSFDSEAKAATDGQSSRLFQVD